MQKNSESYPEAQPGVTAKENCHGEVQRMTITENYKPLQKWISN